MRVDHVFQLKGRGVVAMVKCDSCERPTFGDRARRVSDDATWAIRGVETTRRAAGFSEVTAAYYGILFPLETPVAIGDELELLPSAAAKET